MCVVGSFNNQQPNEKILQSKNPMLIFEKIKLIELNYLNEYQNSCRSVLSK